MNKANLVIFLRYMILLWAYQGIAKAAAEDGDRDLSTECKPDAIHSAFGPTSQEMVVMWTTSRECSTEVYYSNHPWQLNITVSGQVKKLECKNKAAPVYVHRAMLKNLQPGSVVFYVPISDGFDTFPFYFKVPDFDKPSHFILFNDLAATSRKHFVTSLLEDSYTQAFTSLFYLSEPQTLLTEKNGDSFFSSLKTPAVSLPLMIGADWGKEAESELPCERQLFSLPGFDWPTQSNARWYSHDVGPVHFVRFSSRVFLETDGQTAKDMQAWMVADLTEANQNRKRTPWVIALGMDPMYCSEDGHGMGDCSRNDSKIRHGLEDIFYSFAVDLVVEQQDGPYERTWPHYKGIVVAKSYVEPAAPVEIVMGLGKMAAPSTNSSEPQTAAPDWRAVRLPNAGGESYSRLSVANASHLRWQLVSAVDRSVLDDVWLVQSQHGNFSLSTLPHNVSHRINQSIIALGGKPGTYDFIGTLASDQSAERDGEGWSKYSLWFGLALVGAAIGIGLGAVTIRSYLKKKRRHASGGRRWQEVDRHGGGGSGGHFYSVASDTDGDDDNENDFEIDMFERSPKSGSKLLTSY